MTPLKHTELAVRKLLLGFLGRVVRRGIPPPGPLDGHTSKVLFIRQDRIGDVLVSTPLFGSLRNRFPSMVMDAIVSENNRVALENDRTIRKRWIYRKNLLSIVRMIAGIRKERYDVVIDLMDNPSATSTILTLVAGGRWNVGLAKENSYAYDIVVPLLSRREVHIVDRLAQLLTVFGIDPASEDLKISYTVAPASERTVAQYLATAGATGSQLIGVNISAGSETRFWGIQAYRDLIQRLRTSGEHTRILLLSKPSDRDRGNAITRGIPEILLPETRSFDEFAAFIKSLSLLITPDTSAVHLAAAFGIPAVVLYVQSDPNLRIWDPYKSPAVALITPVDDLSTISAEQVAHACARIAEGKHAPFQIQHAGLRGTR